MANTRLHTSTQGSKLYQLILDGTTTPATLYGRDCGKFTITDNGVGDWTLTPSDTLTEPPMVLCQSYTAAINTYYQTAPLVSAVRILATNKPIAQKSAVLSLNGIKFTGLLSGADSNALTITITGGATAGSEVVTSTSAGALTIQVETTVSTATQVYAALKAKTDATVSAFFAFALVTGATTWATAAAANLAGGVDGVAAAATDAKLDVTVICSTTSSPETL